MHYPRSALGKKQILVVVIKYRDDEGISAGLSVRGTAVALQNHNHSDFAGAPLALLGVAGLVLLFFVWTYFY